MATETSQYFIYNIHVATLVLINRFHVLENEPIMPGGHTSLAFLDKRLIIKASKCAGCSLHDK